MDSFSHPNSEIDKRISVHEIEFLSFIEWLLGASTKEYRTNVPFK